MTMKLYGEWTVTLADGETHKWQPDDVTPGQEVMILDSLPSINSYDEWIDAVDERQGVACQVLVWFLRYISGRQEELNSVVVQHRRIRIEHIDNEAVEVDPEASAGGVPAT